MIRYFCDVCNKELSPGELKYSWEMVGLGLFCEKHCPVGSTTWGHFETIIPVGTNPCDDCDFDNMSCNKCIGA